MYSSALTTDSQTYGRTSCTSLNYYYETIQVNVVKTDWYTLSSNSSLDTYGYLYKDHFNPFNPSENLLLRDDDGCFKNQFRLVTYLQSSARYVLVVTTYYSNVTETFSIVAFGPDNVILNHISKYLYYLVNNQHRIYETLVTSIFPLIL
jgi:hypothetical protein